MASQRNRLRRRLLVVALAAASIRKAQAEDATPTVDYFAPLSDLSTPAPKNLEGGQNFTRCCLRALDEWRKNPKSQDFSIQSSKNPHKFFDNVDDLLKAKEQFPCGAEYDDDDDGATRVKISYFWCRSNCSGWQRSRSSVLSQWLQPFVGFILPAAVFCLNVSF